MSKLESTICLTVLVLFVFGTIQLFKELSTVQPNVYKIVYSLNKNSK